MESKQERKNGKQLGQEGWLAYRIGRMGSKKYMKNCKQI